MFEEEIYLDIYQFDGLTFGILSENRMEMQLNHKESIERYSTDFHYRFICLSVIDLSNVFK